MVLFLLRCSAAPQHTNLKSNVALGFTTFALHALFVRLANSPTNMSNARFVFVFFWKFYQYSYNIFYYHNIHNEVSVSDKFSGRNNWLTSFFLVFVTICILKRLCQLVVANFVTIFILVKKSIKTVIMRCHRFLSPPTVFGKFSGSQYNI